MVHSSVRVNQGLCIWRSRGSGSVELDVFVDAEGYLAGVDVSCNANSEPIPMRRYLSNRLTTFTELSQVPESGPSREPA